MKETKQMKETIQTITDEQHNPKKRKEKRIPAELKRLSKWRELLETDEEESGKRQLERKQANQNKQTNETKQSNTPIQATVNWEKQKPAKEEPECETEKTSTTSDEQPKRNRTAPEYYGNPVMICGVDITNEAGEREIITISSDEN